MEVSIRYFIGILHITTTGTEYEAHIDYLCGIHTIISSASRTYLTTADDHRTLTGAVCIFVGFTTHTTRMSRMTNRERS